MSEARESATFDVSIADYRRAFALAVAAWPDPIPPFAARVRARLEMDWRVRAVLLASLGALALGWLVPFPGRTGQLLWLGGVIGAGTAALTLLLALVGAWDDRGMRRRFPREQAAWKCPQRMRIRWDDSGLTLAGREGFGSFGWHMLFSWIDAADELVIFTGMRDPVPVPHAALARDDLEDLRRRLAVVPQGWRLASDEDQRLTRMFR